MPSITGTLTASGNSATLIDVASTEWIEMWGLSLIGKDTDGVATVKCGSTAKFTCPTPAQGVGGISVPSGREPIFQGLVGEDLTINLSAAGSVSYNFWYSIRGSV